VIEKKPSSRDADADNKYSHEKRTHPVDLQSPVQSSDAQKGLGTNPASKETTSKIEEPLKKIERHTLIIAWAGLIVASITGIVFYCQLKEMGRQTKILSDQAKQAAADSIVSEGHTREQLRIANDQARAAQDSVRAIQKQMRQDQRPWIEVLENGTMRFVVNQPLSLPLLLVAKGKTPARMIDSFFIIDYVLNGTTVKFERWKKQPTTTFGTHVLVGSLFPESKSPAEAHWLLKNTSRARLLSEKEWDDLKEARAWIAVHGEVTYRDTFGIKHWTKFCVFKSPAVGKSVRASGCTMYNSVDSN